MTSIYSSKTTKNDKQHPLNSQTTVNTRRNEAVKDHIDLTATSYPHTSSRTFQPPAEVRESDYSFSVYIDLPGLSAQEISITSCTHSVTIQGQRKSPHTTHRIITSTLTIGNFERVIQLPQSILGEQVYAEYSHGVLRLELPKQLNTHTSKQLPSSCLRMTL